MVGSAPAVMTDLTTMCTPNATAPITRASLPMRKTCALVTFQTSSVTYEADQREARERGDERAHGEPRAGHGGAHPRAARDAMQGVPQGQPLRPFCSLRQRHVLASRDQAVRSRSRVVHQMMLTPITISS